MTRITLVSVSLIDCWLSYTLKHSAHPAKQHFVFSFDLFPRTILWYRFHCTRFTPEDQLSFIPPDTLLSWRILFRYNSFHLASLQIKKQTFIVQVLVYYSTMRHFNNFTAVISLLNIVLLGVIHYWYSSVFCVMCVMLHFREGFVTTYWIKWDSCFVILQYMEHTYIC